MTDQPRTTDTLREILADVLASIPRHEWAVRVAQAKLTMAQARLGLAREIASQ